MDDRCPNRRKVDRGIYRNTIGKMDKEKRIWVGPSVGQAFQIFNKLTDNMTNPKEKQSQEWESKFDESGFLRQYFYDQGKGIIGFKNQNKGSVSDEDIEWQRKQALEPIKQFIRKLL